MPSAAKRPDSVAPCFNMGVGVESMACALPHEHSIRDVVSLALDVVEVFSPVLFEVEPDQLGDATGRIEHNQENRLVADGILIRSRVDMDQLLRCGLQPRDVHVR